MPITPTSPHIGKEKRPCFYVKIAGIPVLYGSALPPAATYDLNGTATAYERRLSIVPGLGMRFDRRLNVRESLIECSPVEVVFSSREIEGPADPADPGTTFGRLGFAGADASLELAAGQEITQTQAAPITITMGKDPSLIFSAGDVLHIGQEAFLCGTVNATAKTIALVQRAVLGTRKAAHLFDTTTQVQLIASSPAVYFKGRRAVIYEGTTLPDGTGTDWIERWRGFLAAEPEISTSGRVPTVTIKIAPLTALLDLQMGTQAQDLHLTPKAHAFQWGTGHWVDFLEHVPRGALLNTGTGLRYDRNAAWHGTGRVPVTLQSYERLGGIYNINLSGTDHPLAFPLMVDSGGEGSPKVYVTNGLGGSFTPSGYSSSFEAQSVILLDTGEIGSRGLDGHGLEIPLASNAGDGGTSAQILNAEGSHVREASLVYGLSNPTYGQVQIVDWPGGLVDAINSTGSGGFRMGFNSPYWKTEAAIDGGGGLLMVYLDLDARVLRISCSVTLLGAGVMSAHFADGGFSDEAYETIRTGTGYGHRWKLNAGTNLEARPRRDYVERLSFEALRVGEQSEDNTIAITVPGARSVDASYVEVPIEVARAFYQEGETYLLVDGPVRVPTSGAMFIEAEHPEDGPLGIFKVNLATSQALGDGSTVTLLTLADLEDHSQAEPGRIKTFAEYAGQDRIKLKGAAVFAQGAPIGEVLLQLLCSSGGNGITSSTYDLLPYGAGLTDGSTSGTSADTIGAEVDVDSFLAVASPIPNAQFRPVWRSGQSIKEVIGGLLRACGYVLDLVVNDAGECKISAVPLGLPNRAQVVADITTSDIATSPNPRSDTELAKANVFDFQFAFDARGEHQTQRVKDAVSIDIIGEEKSITVPLPGVELSNDLDRIAQLRPIFSRLRYELALPRRIFEMTIRSGLGVQARVGGTYSLTHPHLRGAKAMGLSRELVRLRSLTENGWKPGARARFVMYGAAGSGWGPSLSCIGVTDTTTLAIASDRHSGASTADAEGFKILEVGDQVLIQPRGDMDTTTTHTISSITDSSITLNAVHGLTADGSNVIAYLTPMRSAIATVPDAHGIYAQIGGVTVI